ncbi:MAG: hypothetical protein F4Y04_02615 [Chloroflexi bacterium]|nr:hypothetical protein [Chloroflexota bacterium]
MADTQTLYFPCPSCGARFCQLEEPDGDIHVGETYHCNECGAAVVLVALSMEMLADPVSIRWGCHFCQPGPCRLAPSNTPVGEPETTESK